MKKQLSPYFLRRAKVKPGKLSEIFNFPRSSRGAAFTSSAPQKPSFQTPAETPPKKRRPFTNHRAVCGAKVSNQVLFMILTSSMLPDFSDNYGFLDFTGGALSRSVPFYRALTSAPLDSPHSISNSSHSQQNGRDGAAAVSPAALNLTRLLPRTKMQAAAFFSTLSSKSPIASRSGRGTNGKTASCHNKSGPGK